MTLEPIAIAEAPAAALPISDASPGDPGFAVDLPVFSGPLAVLLHMIESRQLDILTVPLAELADGYVAHLASNPVEPAQLAEFIAIAAQLILLKSRSLLPGEMPPPPVDVADEPDEEELRRRLLEYRALRDVALGLGQRDLAAPMHRREPRESDLPAAAVAPLPVAVLTALAAGGRVVLQQLLATCRSRTEATVTLLAALELIRRRQVTVQQRELFGPIVLETMA